MLNCRLARSDVDMVPKILGRMPWAEKAVKPHRHLNSFGEGGRVPHGDVLLGVWQQAPDEAIVVNDAGDALRQCS